MKRALSVIAVVLLICPLLKAQKPADILANWSAKNPIEKVYLHFDREHYIAGEIAWFKAYLYSDYQPDTISTTLFAELLNEQGQVIRRSSMPVVLGTANGYFELPDTLKSSTYLVRIYSPTMLNHSIDFVGKQRLHIYGKKNNDAIVISDNTIRIEFFPEGGNLVNGFTSTVAFKASGLNGFPADIKGRIVNEKNETVAGFNSYHDGMGMFEITPAVEGKYYAMIDGDVSGKKYELPAPVSKGIGVTVIPHPQGSFFEIKQLLKEPAFQVTYIVGQMQHHIVFVQEFKTPQAEMQGVINTLKLHSGILQVTFFNKDHQPLAERLCFVDNKEYLLSGELKTDTLDFSPHAKNFFNLKLKDTVRGSFSVAVTDADFDLTDHQENIFSTLLLTSDLKGYVHNPSYYFAADNDSVKTALDLVMMTNGWRRFKWSSMEQDLAKQAGYKDLSYITLDGKIMLRDSKKTFAEKPALVMLIAADSTRRTQMINTDKQGHFRLDSMLFFGKSRLIFSDIRGKKSQFIDVDLSGDSLTKPYLLSAPYKELFARPPVMATNRLVENEYEEIMKAKGLMLEGVIVKARRKNPVQELEEKYTSGAFSGFGATKTIDLVNSDEANSYLNILDYVGARVMGVTVINDGLDYQIYYRQTASISSLGNPPMILYLDEVETDVAVIATIPANQIALIKLFPSFAAATGNAMGGVLAVYTKKGSDMNGLMQNAADLITYQGYTITKEFYAPDYHVEKPSSPDNRITLDWQPVVLVNNVSPRIPLSFYNNDRTKTFRVIVEGMTTDGKMLHIEKVIGKAQK